MDILDYEIMNLALSDSDMRLKPQDVNQIAKMLLNKKAFIDFETQIGQLQAVGLTESKIDLLKKCSEIINKYFKDDEAASIELAVNILSRLISAKFSGKTQTNDAVLWTFERLVYSIANKEKLIFMFGYGGYKHHDSPSSPEVDWAELFHIKFLLKYLWPIIVNYPYGVEIEYESEEVSIQFNNVQQSLTDKYTHSFRKLVDYFNLWLSENDIKTRISFIVAREQYDSADTLYHLMDEKKASIAAQFKDLPKDEQARRLKRAETNIKWHSGSKDYSELLDNERTELILNTRITNETFLEADYDLRADYFERMNCVPLLGTFGRAALGEAWLHIKSNQASLVDFWIGTGILEIREDRLIEKIVSHKQLETIINNLDYVRLAPDVRLIEVSKNFAKMPVYNGTLPF
jgi:hypothetical protein